MAIRKTNSSGFAAAVGAVKRITAWSFSRLKDYKQCPLKAKLKHIDKMKEPGNEAMERGSKIHLLAEDWTKGKLKKFPAELAKFKAEFAVLKKGKAICEEDWAFRSDWTPCAWNDWNNVWVRVKVDAILVDTKTGVVRIIDHKTGKPADDHQDQLSLYAVAAFVMFPAATKVISELWYLDTGDKTEADYDVGQLPELKAHWGREVKALLSDTSFCAKPNNRCKWCWFRKENIEPGAPRLCKY